MTEPSFEVTILHWRDIPAQVIVGSGRRAVKRQLPERFEQAIDRCAMRVGARDSDAYLAEWRKAPPVRLAGPSDIAVAEAVLARLVRDFDEAALARLVANEGRAAAAGPLS